MPRFPLIVSLGVGQLVCYTAVFSVVNAPPSFLDDPKNCCVADYGITYLRQKVRAFLSA